MRVRRSKLPGYCTALALAGSLAGACLPARGIAGPIPREERWDPRHISLLPPEVRSVLPRYEAKCGPPAAEHLFSRSIEVKGSGQSFIALHYELFRCPKRETLCDAAGCLHEIFASTGGGPYRLVLRIHVQEVTLHVVEGRPAVELECGDARCRRLLKWDGRRFVNGTARSGWEPESPSANSRTIEKRSPT